MYVNQSFYVNPQYIETGSVHPRSAWGRRGHPRGHDRGRRSSRRVSRHGLRRVRLLAVSSGCFSCFLMYVSVVIFCKTFVKCSADRWADTADTVQPNL